MTEPIFCPDSPDYENAARAQIRAADPAHSAWVSANAGSGKTKVLIDRVARLLLKGASPDSILCVTYTKAAANEMLERLFAQLGTWSVLDENTLKTKLAALESRVPDNYTEAELRDARALFAKALETPGGLRIETIHAFCSRILRRFPLEANVAPGFNEIDDVDADEFWGGAVKTGLLDAAADQRDILDTVALAGGGLGVTSGLDTARNHGSALLGFSEAHGHDLARMDAALQSALNAPEQDADTLIADAMAALPLADLGRVVEILEADGKSGSMRVASTLRSVFETTDPTARWQLYRGLFFTQAGSLRKAVVTKPVLKHAEAAALFETAELPEGTEVLRIKALDADIKAARLYARTRALVHLALPILRHYQKAKRDHAALDFDDLIAVTHRLLTKAEAANWVLYKLDGGLTHILLDEAQDTSPDQWGLLNALTEEFFAGAGPERAQDPRTLFVVGDEKQSIYSFQGADPQKFLEERQSFEARARAAFGAAELPEMSMSFRSSPQILQFVDRVSECGEVEGHPYIAGPVAEANLSLHTARRSNQPGCVELWPIDVPEQEEEAIPAEAPRDTQSAQSPKNKLARKVSEEIRKIIDTGEMIWAEDAERRWAYRPATAGDVLILVDKRTGGLFDALISALKEQSIPVAGADRLILADHIGVQDCLNLLRFTLLPDDDLTLAEILRGPFANLVDDDVHLFPLAHKRGTESLWQRLCASSRPEHQTVRAFLDQLLVWRALPAFEFLSNVLETPSVYGDTGWDLLAARLGPPMRDPVQALLMRAMAYDAKSAASLQGFVASMEGDESQIKRDLAAPNGQVRVMTVHGAKGLQAPIVILPDSTRRPETSAKSVVEISGAPVWLSKAGDDTAQTELARQDAALREGRERRRLLYVALTRAQDRLIICGAWTGQRPKPDKEVGTGYDKASWYALCVEAMTLLDADRPMDENNGRPLTWRFGPLPPKGETGAQKLQAEASAPGWLTRPAPQDAAPARLLAPTSLLAEDAPVLPPMGDERAARLKRGRLIHALLERLPALPMADREKAGAAFLASDSELDDTQRKDMLDAAMGVLTDPQFDEVFGEGGRPEAPVIGTAPELPAGTIINGRVDRLIVTATDVLIIDFKTDRPPPKTAEKVGTSYLLQMAAYRAVLRKAYPNHTIRAALVWTDGPALMPLPADLLEKTLSQTSLAV